MKQEIEKKHYLGQNFLKDQNILRKEVQIANVVGKTVLEIGPGDGALTSKILESKPKKLTVVEMDKRFAELLNEKFKDRIEIINEDFLEWETTEKFDIILGNIPYYISSQIIFKIKDREFDRCVLIVQKEFAKKMVAKPNDSNYGRLSVTSQLFFEVRYVQSVPKQVFSPVPKVDSAMIELKRRDVKIGAFEENVVRHLFSHKNQSVRKSLGHSKEFSKEELDKLGDYAKRKVRTLTKEEVLDIIKMI